jgi:peptidoglycan/LPS O-acetylase OafA/YrhL
MLDARPARFRHWSIPALGAWTVFVWVSRTRNLLRGDESAWWLVPVVLFLAGGVVCLVAWRRGRESYVAPIRAFAVLGSAYWVLRTVVVVAGDRSTGFKLVHAVLALVTVALSAAVLQRLRRAEMVPRGAFL